MKQTIAELFNPLWRGLRTPFKCWTLGRKSDQGGIPGKTSVTTASSRLELFGGAIEISLPCCMQGSHV